MLLVLFSSGCATNSLVPNPMGSSSLSDSNGILVGSFSRDPRGQKYYSQTFYFINTSTDEVHSIKSQPTFNMFTGKTPDDFKTSESNGGLFVFSLPAGKYSFNDFRLYQSNGYFEKNWSSEKPYSIPFEVHANKVNYVGEIKLMPLTGKNLFGMSVQAGGVWVISDQSNRDLKIFSTKYADIPIDNMVKVIPDSKEVFTPLVILPSEENEHNKRVN
jgi:hypothetical protein